LDYLTTHTSLSPIRRGFAPGFVYYKKGCTRLAAASVKGYQLLAHGRCFSPGTPASSTTKAGHHDIAEILLKGALNTKNQINQLLIKERIVKVLVLSIVLLQLTLSKSFSSDFCFHKHVLQSAV
jgi:hypothetical protein